eukprot:jgi/Pico_ML_1/51668/g242.t1
MNSGSNPFARGEEPNPFVSSSTRGGRGPDAATNRDAEQYFGSGGRPASTAWGGVPQDESGLDFDAPLEETGGSQFVNNQPSSAGSFGGRDEVAPATSTGEVLSKKEVAKRKKELDKREKELNKREKELERRERGVVLADEKNWPPLLKLTHHDIAKDIPEAVVVLIATGMKEAKFSDILLALIYMAIGIPAALFLWYFRLYNAAKKDGAVGYAAFFLFFLLNVVWCIFCAVAPPINNEMSFAGFMTSIKLVDRDENFLFIMYLASAIAWTTLSVWNLYVIKYIYSSFRGKNPHQVAARAASELS